jgi:hypothetical protein
MTVQSSERAVPAQRCLSIATALLQWRLPAIETYPQLVAFAQTHAGKIALFVLFAVLMKLVARDTWVADNHMWLLMTVAPAAVSLTGRHRRLAMLACTALALVHFPQWFDFRAVDATIRQEKLSGEVNVGQLRAVVLIAYFLLAAVAIHFARRCRDHPLWRRPALALHIVYFCLLGLAASRLLHGLQQVLLWSLTAVFTAYFWYLAYALMDQRRRQPEPPYFQLATFNPFFFQSAVPFGKGASDWRGVEAGSREELAVTQLKALKLLAWALILKEVVLRVFRWGAFDILGIPPFWTAFERFANGGDVSGLPGVFSIITNFPEQILILAIPGHVFVAIARLAGFRLLRNTCRPLSARTIAEFWNRYFYYFKEILVQVYFYPTYVRWFKHRPRLRIAFATFMAAGVGNFLYHFMVNFANFDLVRFGPLEALRRTQTYAFYCVLLVAGIVVSQLRARKPDANAGWWRGQFLPSLGVAVFFTFLLVFDGPFRHLTLARHFSFLLHVFGLTQWIKPIG